MIRKLLCRPCGAKPLLDLDGAIAVATTHWRKSELEPRNWEEEYGTVLDERAVKMADALNDTLQSALGKGKQ